MDAAGLGEVVVSSTVKDLVAASGLRFSDRGNHDLRGVPGECVSTQFRLTGRFGERYTPPYRRRRGRRSKGDQAMTLRLRNTAPALALALTGIAHAGS